MQVVVCAMILLASGQVLLDSPVARTEPRELYQRAAAAIAGQDLATATGLLEELTQNHSDSPLTEVAAFHLGECYLLQSQPAQALLLLQVWSKRIDTSDTAEQLEPGITNQTWQLLSNVLRGLPNDSRTLELLEEILAPSVDAVNEHLPDQWEMALALELSKRYERNKNFSAAQSWLGRAIEASARGDSSTDSELEHKFHCELPLAWAEHAISTEQPQTAVEVLQTALANRHQVDRELALRFLLAEAYFAAGQPARASEQFQWLTNKAAESNPPPAWLAAVTLRRAELLVRSRAIGEARTLLQQAKKEHDDFELAYEFDYLMARCAVARIEFDEAIGLLQQVIDAPAARGKEAFARAAWMLGEVHFLQRNYPQAVAAYAQVVSLDNFPQWQARALLQSAKCHELLGDALAAVADYRRAAEFSQQPEITQTAAERMAVIESATTNLR